MLFKAKAKIWQYFLEIFLIIVGISLSLYLDKMMTEHDQSKIERTLLEGMYTDLRNDSTVNARFIYMNKIFINSMYKTINATSFEDVSDSLHIYMDYMITYTKLNSSNTAYLEMVQSGQSRLLKNKELARKIIYIYTNMIPHIQSWNKIDEDFVLNRMIPFYEDNIYEYVSMMKGQKSAESAFKLIQTNTRFRNLIQSNILWKESVQSVMEQSQNIYRQIIKEVKEELDRTS